MADAVYLHIGTPKTGTTYVQGVLRANAERLRERGYTVAAAGQPDLVRAMFDLTGLRSGPQIAGAWDRLARQVSTTAGAVVMSQEELCLATTEQAGEALRSLQSDDVTVVITARDLARQVASHWQQQLKARFPGTLAEMFPIVVSRTPTEDDFWGHQELVAIIDHWLAHVPPERVVVVTVPPAGQPPELLWDRFAAACDLDPAGFDLAVDRPNESLGAVQAELLRRVNVELGDRLQIGAGYYAVVRAYVANDLLARQPHHEPYGLEPEAHEWAVTTAREWIAGIRARGVRVVGDLNDLVPPAWESTVGSAPIDEADLSRLAVSALTDVLVERGGRPGPGRTGAGGVTGGGARRRTNVPESG